MANGILLSRLPLARCHALSFAPLMSFLINIRTGHLSCPSYSRRLRHRSMPGPRSQEETRCGCHLESGACALYCGPIAAGSCHTQAGKDSSVSHVWVLSTGLWGHKAKKKVFNTHTWKLKWVILRGQCWKVPTLGWRGSKKWQWKSGICKPRQCSELWLFWQLYSPCASLRWSIYSCQMVS